MIAAPHVMASGTRTAAAHASTRTNRPPGVCDEKVLTWRHTESGADHSREQREVPASHKAPTAATHPWQ